MSEGKYSHLEKVRAMVEACYRCGDCRIAYRPAVGRYQVCPVREAVPAKWEPFFARGKIMLIMGLLYGDLQLSQELADIIYQCTICGSCKFICNYSYHPSLPHPLSQKMDHPKIWEALRAELVEAGFPLPKHAQMLAYCQENYNPYFEPHAERLKWIPKGKTFPKEADYVLFMGCTEPYRIPEILQNTIRILDIAKVNYTILAEEEWCCGSVALRTGDRKIAENMAKHNLEALKKTKATHLITHCAGCYRTLKFDYPDLLPEFNIQVLHITELIKDLIAEGALQLKKQISRKITYHDPCHLGRHAQIYEAPRYILNHIPGIDLVEMQRIKENAWCCGAGGGVKSGFPDLALQIAKTRIQEALDTGADAIVTACPFCLRNLQDAAKELEGDQTIEVLDLLDLLLQAL
ncbi:MAG TPA: (Fe-S)-binding protein [Candidatus Deferrimicrobium sp.]|nr:(Fe-S)-binding protein [Candidatus Deferrimicrobium sp.]